MARKPLNFDFSEPPKPGPEIHAPVSESPATAEVVEATPFDKFDLVAAQKHHSFLTIKNKLAEMRKMAADLKISDKASFDKAVQMQIQIKALVRGVDEAKKNHPSYKVAAEFKLGMDKYTRENLSQPLESLDRQIDPKVKAYNRSVAELERRKAAKEAAEAAEKARKEAEAKAKADKEKQEQERKEAIQLQQKLNLDADNAGVERVQVPIPEVVVQPELPSMPEIPATPRQEKIVADHGSAKTEMVWVCNIVNPDEVPMRYCRPDQDLLDRAVEAGVREIPGCEIIEQPITKIRLSRKKKEAGLIF